jgi:hypothetical protein
MVVVYALLGSLHPVFGDDPFFLLNHVRWLVEHHEIPWVDHFSFTAQEQPCVYPVGGSLLFYGLWLISGYALLSRSAGRNDSACCCAGDHDFRPIWRPWQCR